MPRLQYLQTLPQVPLQGHPKQMSEPSQLTPLYVEEKRLYAESFFDDRAPYPISKGMPSQPVEEVNFSQLYPGSRPFSDDPDFITIAEGHTKKV